MRAAATSRSGCACSRRRGALVVDDRAGWSGRGTRAARGRRRRRATRSAGRGQQGDRGAGVEHQVVEHHGRGLAGGDPGEQVALASPRRRAGAPRRWRCSWRAGARGPGWRRAPRGPRPSRRARHRSRRTPRGREGQRRRPARRAPATGSRRTRPRTRVAARTAALSLRLSSSDRTMAASSSCSSVRAKCISATFGVVSRRSLRSLLNQQRGGDPAAVVRRGAPGADQRADPVDPEAEVELGGVADRAVHLEGHP